MSSICFETEGCVYSYGRECFTCISINPLVGRRLFSILFSGPRVETVISKVQRNDKILNAQWKGNKFRSYNHNNLAGQNNMRSIRSISLHWRFGFLVSAIKGCIKWNGTANITGRRYLSVGLLLVMTERVVVGGNASDLHSINAWH